MMDKSIINQCSVVLTRKCNLRCSFCYAKDAGYCESEMVSCIWRILTAGFAEQNGRNAKLNGRITFDY